MHVNLLLILRPKRLTFVTTSNSFPLTTIGSKDLGFALNKILNSLHLSGLSCILFSIDHTDTESAIFWALLIECFGTISEAVESSIYFQKSACVTLRSFINKIKSQGPNFDPWGHQME